MASNPRRSTMTEQHVIEQLEIRCNGKGFILRRLRECLDALKAALAQEVFVRGTAEASSSSPATSSTSTPSSLSPMATLTGPTTHMMQGITSEVYGVAFTECSTPHVKKGQPFSPLPVGSKRSHSVMASLHSDSSTQTTMDGL
ncbi:MAG: hypothetical protein EOO65_04035 [Methanosarcinales archaeon]|nr:MAG: hypothetical protein EOO65_04035 [Methanosarcinales archaeon]